MTVEIVTETSTLHECVKIAAILCPVITATLLICSSGEE